MVDPSLIIGCLCSYAAAAVPGKTAIRLLKRLNARQNISVDAPSTHIAKQGTPTMGGLLVALALTVTTIAYLAIAQVGEHRHPSEDYALVPVLLVTLAFSGIGFADDYLSAKRGKNLGLRAREKMAAQILVASAFCVWLYMTAHPGLTTFVELLPASLVNGGQHGLIGSGPVAIDLGIAYYPIAVAFIVGLSNATNFTDGCDGLCSGLSIIISLALAVLVYAMRPELGFYTVALAGGLAGFLYWNAHPARVFMGDTFSLAIGAGLAAVAIMGKQEVGLIVASLVCWAELISVMIQVTVFKIRKNSKGIEFAKANRVFKRAPLHHHFEELGWNETTVVTRFWIAGGICAALSLLWVRG